VNNSPYPAFDGCCYADVDVTSENMTQVEMDFSKEKVEELSCMYVVLCPYSDDGMSGEEFMIDKTSNYTLTSSPPDTVSSEETKEQPELETEPESDVEKTGRIKNLSDYLESASCYNIIQVNEDVAACVSAKEERYAVDFLNLRSGNVMKSIESGFDGLRMPIDVDVDVAGSYVVCKERSFSVSDYGKEYVYILDDKYEVIETLALSGKVTNQAYTILPAQRKIVYIDSYGKEWKSCLKEMDFDGKNKKTILKFSEQSKLDSLDGMKVSPDEKKIYFTGCYEDKKNSGGNMPRCIGLIDLEEKDYEVYHEGKVQICVEKDGAYFYDENSGETDGKVCRIAYDGKFSCIQTGETESGDTGFSIGKNLFWSVSTIKCEEGEEDRTPDILRIYDVKDGTLVYEDENMYISSGALVFDEERIICGLYIGDEGLRTKEIRF
ncbi:MAG: hypothetical protein K2K09_05660, partial [Lachnospiraceae bacterium]|nr:hypothetical protein [Lachnospiraceae bacterium]